MLTRVLTLLERVVNTPYAVNTEVPEVLTEHVKTAPRHTYPPPHQEHQQSTGTHARGTGHRGQKNLLRSRPPTQQGGWSHIHMRSPRSRAPPRAHCEAMRACFRTAFICLVPGPA